MNVGSDNFRFTLDDPEAKAVTVRQPKTAELHIDSLDRYATGDTTSAGVPAGTPSVLLKLGGHMFISTADNAANCKIVAQRNLLYGYFSRIAPTQFQLFYRVPTVVSNVNDTLSWTDSPDNITFTNHTAVLPFGYHNIVTLGAAISAAMIAASPTNLATLVITPPTNQTSTITGTTVIQAGYRFTLTGGATMYFNPFVAGSTVENQTNYLKNLWLIGGSKGLTGTSSPGAPIPWATVLGSSPNMVATQYVDIVSSSLSNYKDSKDGNTDAAGTTNVIGRVYMTEYPVSTQTANNGFPQDGLWGMNTMSFTKTWTNPNWSQYSPNQAISSIDISLLDQWGLPLFWSSVYCTEFQMTLTCTE